MRTASQRVRTKEKEWGNLRVLANRNEAGMRGVGEWIFLTADGGFKIQDLKFQTRGYDILWLSCLCDGLELGW
jgi:hypothetical protein